MSALSSSLSGAGGLGIAPSAAPSRFGQLKSEDFVKIMFTELTNQDPLKPNDSNTLLQQFSSLRNIEADISLQKKLGEVVSQGQLSTAGALLGKYVQGYTENFDPTEGVVRSITQTADGPVLNLVNGARIPFKNVHSIFDPPTATTPTTPATPPNAVPNPAHPATPTPTNSGPARPIVRGGRPAEARPIANGTT